MPRLEASFGETCSPVCRPTAVFKGRRASSCCWVLLVPPAEAFQNHDCSTKPSCCASLPQAIETALDCLKSANTEPYYRRQAWEVIKCFLVAMMSLEDNKHALYQLLAHPKYAPPGTGCVSVSELQGGVPPRPLCVGSVFLQVRERARCLLSPASLVETVGRTWVLERWSLSAR